MKTVEANLVCKVANQATQDEAVLRELMVMLNAHPLMAAWRFRVYNGRLIVEARG